MKKLISMLLLLAMVLGLFAGCGKDEEKQTPAGLQSAAEYLSGMYQTAGKDEAIVITADQDVLKSVVVDGVSYGVEWAVEVTEGAADSVTVAESTKENHVKLDIPLHSGSDILFTATATISDISAVGSKRAATLPSRSTTNFVKFHLISGLLAQSGSASENIFSRSALNGCSWKPSKPFWDFSHV